MPIPCLTAPLGPNVPAPGEPINSTNLGIGTDVAQIPGGGTSMRRVVKSEAFWTMLIAVVVPFGWLLPLLRMAYRYATR